MFNRQGGDFMHVSNCTPGHTRILVIFCDVTEVVHIRTLYLLILTVLTILFLTVA